jgi:hypothetical protein
MLKGTVDMVMGIVTSPIVADPLIVGAHVGRVGMPGLIDKPLFPCAVGCWARCGSWALAGGWRSG